MIRVRDVSSDSVSVWGAFVLRILLNLAPSFARWKIPLVCCSGRKHQRHTFCCLPPVNYVVECNKALSDERST